MFQSELENNLYFSGLCYIPIYLSLQKGKETFFHLADVGKGN